MQKETRLHKVMTWFERIIIAGLITLSSGYYLFKRARLEECGRGDERDEK